MKLVSGGVHRDGGSISADFEREDGSFLSVLLEVRRISEQRNDRHFGHLHAGAAIQNTCDPTTIVEKGSVQEALLIAELAGWFKFGEIAEGEEAAASALKDLYERLPSREG